MSRSKWKLSSKTLNNKTQDRHFIITTNQINQIVEIYNGMSYNKITITKDMVGHKLGEYSMTRKRHNRKK